LQTFRVRLTLMFAALFLIVGAALLGITYSLVAGLPVKVPKPTPAQQKLAPECKQGNAAAGKVPAAGVAPTATPTPESASSPLPVARCGQAFSAVGAELAAHQQRDQTLAHLLEYSLIALGAMTVVSGGLGWLMAGRVLRPVSSITAAARRASERHLGERLALTGPKDELKELADTFDQMLERLDAAFGPPAPVRRRRVARTADPADRDAHRDRCDHGQAGPDAGAARGHGGQGRPVRGAGRGADRGTAHAGGQRAGTGQPGIG